MPLLVPRIGYCEFNCTLCGQVCPTGALHHQGTAVGEMRHEPGLVARLVAARLEHRWIPPEVSDD